MNVQFVMKGQVLDRPRRYLGGVSSGLAEDAHGERMTKTAIDSFMEQANSGDILLYPDVHKIRKSNDIGILEKAQILDNGDWWTEYRLYDEQDLDPNLHNTKLATIDTLWRQLRGDKPYKNPHRFGFSIEGKTSENGIISTPMNKAINEVMLDGVVMVPEPAYRTSVAQAIEKALDGVFVSKGNSISSRLIQDESMDDLYEKRYQIEHAFNDLVAECLERGGSYEELARYFDDYRDSMIPILMQTSGVAGLNAPTDPYTLSKRERREVIVKSLRELRNGLEKLTRRTYQ